MEIQHGSRITSSLDVTLDTHGIADGMQGSRPDHHWICAEVGRDGIPAAVRGPVPSSKDVSQTDAHGVGQALLARLLSDATGEKDLVARLGGEEFALILANQNIEQAARTAEILRQRVRAELSAAIGHEQEVSASFGLAQLAPGEALSDLARRSDLALYEAKNTGRDKVSLAPVDKPPLAHGHPVLISSRTAA